MGYKIIHNSQEAFYRNPFGAVALGTKVYLRLKVEGLAQQVLVRTWIIDEEAFIPMVKEEDVGAEQAIYCAELKVPREKCLVWYYFIIDFEDERVFYGNNSECYGGLGMDYKDQPKSFQITVHSPEAKTPSWFKDGVIYQIFPDRFFNGDENGKVLNPKNNTLLHARWEDNPIYLKDQEGGIKRWTFFGGNLEGIIKKLSYLKDLGISIIYLNPIFKSPSNHRYDISDYKQIDPMLGDRETFKKLCCQAEAMGIKIIIDGVFSHTGSDSIYFNKEGNFEGLGAYQSPESPYYKWYRFMRYPEVYESWWGIEDLPNVNELEPSYMDYIIYDEESVLNYWMDSGVKGWRLDVVDELPDQFIKAFWKKMKEKDPEGILLGEVWEDASNKVSYDQQREYFLGEELDSVMNYPFRKILIDFILNHKDAEATHLALMSLYENYPKEYFYSTMNLLGSHDVSRIFTILCEIPFDEDLYDGKKPKIQLTQPQIELCKEKLKLITLFQMTFPGVPSIYYGDETALEGHHDPYNRGTYPWGNEDKELINWFKTLLTIRNNHAALRTGEWKRLMAEGDLYGYIRSIVDGKDGFGNNRPNETLVILLNKNIEETKEIVIDLENYKDSSLEDLLHGNKLDLVDGLLKIKIKPLEGKILLLEK